MSLRAAITNISRTSVHDGPGVRTVVYFKGCGLRCKWCHNPETMEHKREILYTSVKCICCGKCIEICPQCHAPSEDKMIFLRDSCTCCGKCVEVCPTGAIKSAATEMESDEVMREVRKDKNYYMHSGGGVTLSGGECLLQSEFCEELLKKCKEEDIHTLIETALFVPWSNVERVLPYCDEFFADFKIADAQKHEYYTGGSNKLILANLQKLAQKKPFKVTVRIPLIPGVNDAEEDVEKFAEMLSGFADKLSGIEILRYNVLADSKYEICGKEYSDFGKAQSDEELLDYCNRLKVKLCGKADVFTVI